MPAQLIYTPVDDITEVCIPLMFGFLVKCSSCSTQIHAELQKTFKTGKTRPIAFRKEQLAQLAHLLKDNEQRFREALKADLGRPEVESDLCVALHAYSRPPAEI